MKIEEKIKKGDRVQLRFGHKPKGTVVNTAWGDVVNRNGKKVGRMLWVRARWDDCGYDELDPHDSVIAKDVRLLTAVRGIK